MVGKSNPILPELSDLPVIHYGSRFGSPVIEMPVARVQSEVVLQDADNRRAILGRMKSIADDLRHETAAAIRRLPVADRIAMALALGDDDLSLYMRTAGLGRAEALARLRAQRARGRAVLSKAASPD
jgi:hypothetical protein